MILLIDCGSLKTPDIERCIDDWMDVKVLPFWDVTTKDLEGIKGLVFSGAPILITEIDMTPYLEHSAFIKTLSVPVLGICFGHQLIGLHYDAQASRQRDDRDWQQIALLEEHPLFDRLPLEVEMMEDHCETISIPKEFRLLACSDACINEAMCHETKPIYGVQFHPEISGNMGSLLIENFIRIVEEYHRNT